jgi:hypothetical protein
MARPIKRLQAEPNVIAELRRRSRSTTIGVRDRERANIILLRIEGLRVEAVAERLSTTPKRVSMWSTRFARSGLDGLADEPDRGRKASICGSARHHRRDVSAAWQAAGVFVRWHGTPAHRRTRARPDLLRHRLEMISPRPALYLMDICARLGVSHFTLLTACTE